MYVSSFVHRVVIVTSTSIPIRLCRLNSWLRNTLVTDSIYGVLLAVLSGYYIIPHDI
jgi:hypothetical protein